MAGDQAIKDMYPATLPHTFAAMQKLVMAMADVANNVGKKTFFGRDRGVIAYEKFMAGLKQAIIGLTLDGIIRESSTAEEVVDKLSDAIVFFSKAFPNWQEAYVFADYFFDDREQCVAVINRLRTHQ